MLSPEERLEQLEKLLDELEAASQTIPIIVEGRRDARALNRLGIAKNVIPINTGSSVFSLCEEVAKHWKQAVILTDWDRKGGQLARMLKEGLHANGVQVNTYFRTQIVILSKKEVKDIESMPRFIERLRDRRVEGIGTRRAGKMTKDLVQ